MLASPVSQRFRAAVVLAALAVLFVVGQAQALVGINPGVRAGYYFDPEAFHIGVDADLNFTMIHFNPNIEWAFADGGDLFTFNADAFMTLPFIPVIDTWAGAGAALLYAKPDTGDSQTDAGLNLIAGIGLNLPLSPYAMVKYIIADNNDGFVLTVGVRF